MCSLLKQNKRPLCDMIWELELCNNCQKKWLKIEISVIISLNVLVVACVFFSRKMFWVICPCKGFGREYMSIYDTIQIKISVWNLLSIFWWVIFSNNLSFYIKLNWCNQKYRWILYFALERMWVLVKLGYWPTHFICIEMGLPNYSNVSRNLLYLDVNLVSTWMLLNWQHIE